MDLVAGIHPRHNQMPAVWTDLGLRSGWIVSYCPAIPAD
jgi:hypothetical protein